LDLAALTRRMGPAKTVHALLGARPGTRYLTHHAAHPLDVDVLIVDETSMVHLEMMAALLQALPPTARLIVLGDKDQLASVEAGAVLGDLCAHAEQPAYSPETVAFVLAASGEVLPGAADAGGGEVGGPRSSALNVPPLAQHTVMLRHSQRFGGTIGALAQAVNAGQAARAHALFNQDHSGAIWLAPTAQATPADVLALAVGGRAQAPASYADYAALLARQPQVAPVAQPATPASPANPVTAAHAGQQDDPAHHAHTAWVKAVLRAWDHFRVLCAVHDGPWGDRELNRGIQRSLAQAGWLKPEGEWYVGRPVMVTRNDAALGVFNGDVGVVLPSANGGKALRAWFLDGDHLRSVAVSRLAHVDTAFAMTVHKSQGSEFLHTVLVLPPGGGEVMSRELIYTGITRARTHFSLVEAEPGLLAAAIRQRLARASGLPLKLAQHAISSAPYPN
jgi:exodeoxyribonuclease V alpha subunit